MANWAYGGPARPHRWSLIEQRFHIKGSKSRRAEAATARLPLARRFFPGERQLTEGSKVVHKGADLIWNRRSSLRVLLGKKKKTGLLLIKSKNLNQVSSTRENQGKRLLRRASWRKNKAQWLASKLSTSQKAVQQFTGIAENSRPGSHNLVEPNSWVW